LCFNGPELNASVEELANGAGNVLLCDDTLNPETGFGLVGLLSVWTV
jgi:hypothetical protein